jgi:CheY-like chemotaxis protein
MKHLLIVDDERVIADTLCRSVRTVGYSATAAYSGEQALELAALQPPDMLISDVIMPGINGFELAIKVLQQWPACAVLVVSGQAATGALLESAKRAGYLFDVLAKPAHPLEVLAIVKRHLDPQIAVPPGESHA